MQEMTDRLRKAKKLIDFALEQLREAEKEVDAADDAAWEIPKTLHISQIRFSMGALWLGITALEGVRGAVEATISSIEHP